MFASLDGILGPLYFGAFALIAVVCAASLVFTRNPLSGALNLIGVMLSLSGIYALLDSPFMAVLQVLVYAGAIMMLVVFVIMVLNQAKDHVIPGPDGLSFLCLGLPLVIGFLLVLTVGKTELAPAPEAQRAGAEVLAKPLFDLTAGGPGYYLLFELIGILLLVAVVAAVLLAKRTLDTPAEVTDESEAEESHGAH